MRATRCRSKLRARSTSAAVDARVRKVVDLKAPGSGEVARNLWSNLDALGARDQIKFVLADRADYDWARASLAEHTTRRALRGAVLAGLRQARAARTRRMDPRRPAAGALPDAVAQVALGRGRRAMMRLTMPCKARRARFGRHGFGGDACARARRGFRLPRAQRRLRPAPCLRARRRRSASPRTLGAVEHKTVHVDLRSIGGSALTADIDVPERRRRRHSGYLCAGAQHDHARRSRSAGPKCSARAISSAASTRSTIPAIRIAARNSSTRSSVSPIWRRRPASKARACASMRR